MQEQQATSHGVREDTKMADWSLPTITDLYTNIITYFRNRDIDNARMFSTAYTIATNVETGTIRWNNANKNWEIYNGATWSASNLATKYIIDVDFLDGQHGSYYQNAGNLNAGTLLGARFNDTSHGSRSGGTLHPAVTTSVNGFMSTTDKLKLNSITVSSGTFTPVLTDGTNNASLSQAVGEYERIGQVVSIFILIDLINVGSMSGAIKLTGFPFGAGLGNMHISSGHNVSLVSRGDLYAIHGAVQTNTEIRLKKQSATGTTDLLTSDIGIGTLITLSGTIHL